MPAVRRSSAVLLIHTACCCAVPASTVRALLIICMVVAVLCRYRIVATRALASIRGGGYTVNEHVISGRRAESTRVYAGAVPQRHELDERCAGGGAGLLRQSGGKGRELVVLPRARRLQADPSPGSRDSGRFGAGLLAGRPGSEERRRVRSLLPLRGPRCVERAADSQGRRVRGAQNPDGHAAHLHARRGAVGGPVRLGFVGK